MLSDDQLTPYYDAQRDAYDDPEIAPVVEYEQLLRLSDQAEALTFLVEDRMDQATDPQEHARLQLVFERTMKRYNRRDQAVMDWSTAA
jgi:hypothetical protein